MDRFSSAHSTDLCALTALELRSAFRSRKISPLEVARAVFDRIDTLNPVLTAFVTETRDLAERQAKDAEIAYGHGETEPPLLGIPVSVKDLIPTRGIRTTFGSYIFEHYVPDADAPAVERLYAAGAVLLGKTATPEFAMKAPTTSPLFGSTHNPWKLDRTPGGSSGGSAVAVATGMGPLSLGTDSGGSVRQPASFCGIVGLKPSTGRVPTAPVSVIGHLDATGPLGRTVRDVALMLDVIAGADERDWYSIPRDPGSYLHEVDGGVRHLRVAWSGDLGYGRCDPEVLRIAQAACRRFEELGCSVEEAHPQWTNPCSLYEMVCDEIEGPTYARYLPEWESKMDPEIVRLVRGSGSKTTAELANATLRRVEFQLEARRFFRDFDLLMTPTVAVPAFELGVDQPSEVAGESVDGDGWTPFTRPFNLTGHPAITVPAGWTADGLPIGLQIVAPWRNDQLALKAAAAFEALAPWADKWPPLIKEHGPLA